MILINKFLRNLKPYKLASHKIWSVSSNERSKILKLDWNEATILPSPKVAERIKNIVEKGNIYNYYPSTQNEELLDKLAMYTGMSKENLQYFASSDSLHEYIAKMYITIGDPILILGPSYDNFRLTCEANGASVNFFYFADDFSFDPIAFEKQIQKLNPSLVYICNPNNPTGILHSINYIKHLLDEYPDTMFLVDEAYAEFTRVSVKELVVEYDNILISRTMSKAFAIANFRFGYLIASARNVKEISKIRNPKNISTFAQEAAIGVLSDVPYMEAYVDEVLRAKKMFCEELSRYDSLLTTFAQGGNFVLIKFNNVELKNKVQDHLTSRDIFVRSQTHHPSLLSCFRITIGTCEQMRRVLYEIAQVLNEA